MTEDQAAENIPPVPPPPPQQRPKALYGRGTVLAIGVVLTLYAGITVWKLLNPAQPPAVPQKAAAAAATETAPAAAPETGAQETGPAAPSETAAPDAAAPRETSQAELPPSGN